MSQSHGHAHGQGHARLKKWVSPFLWVYHTLYIPPHLWLARQLGGSAWAGTWSHRSRIIRGVGNIISLSAVISIILIHGFNLFWQTGAYLPPLALGFFSIGLVTNTIGWLIGVGTAHLKVEQYYNAHVTLHAENNDLRPESEKKPMKHGLRKTLVNFLRTLHDINGGSGTLLSFVVSIPEILTLLALPVYFISPQVACLIFLISRASAVFSVSAIWGTNHLRLWAQRKDIEDGLHDFYEIKASQQPTRHSRIIAIVNAAFNNLGIDRQHKYSVWVYARCYKAVDGYLKDDTQNDPLVINTLQDALSKFKTSNRFDREKLRAIQGPKQAPTSVLQSMPLLEKQLFEQLSIAIDQSEYQQNHAQVNGYLSKVIDQPCAPRNLLLSYHLMRRKHQDPSESFKSDQPAPLFKPINGTADKYCINEGLVLHKYGIQTAHGTPGLDDTPEYYAQKIVAEVFQKRNIEHNV